MPELIDGEFLHELLVEIGTVKPESSGSVGFSWQEVKAWSDCWSGICGGWELNALHSMSHSYANQFNDSNDKDREPPYLSGCMEEKEEEAKEERLNRCRNFFEAHVKE